MRLVVFNNYRLGVLKVIGRKASRKTEVLLR